MDPPIQFPQPLAVKTEGNVDGYVNDGTLSTVEAVGNWNLKIRKGLLRNCIAESYVQLDIILKDYMKSFENDAIYFEDVETLRKKMVSHINYFHLYFKELKCCFHDSYLERMEDILTLYCKLEFEVFALCKVKMVRHKTIPSVVRRIVYMLRVHLLEKEMHVYHVLIKLNMKLNQPGKDLWNAIYSHFLDKPPLVKTDEAFCRAYILYQNWKEVRRKEEWGAMDQQLYRQYQRTPDDIKNNPILSSILMPKVESTIDLIMQLTGSSPLDITNEYFKHLRNRKYDDVKFVPSLDFSDDEDIISNTNFGNDEDGDFNEDPEFLEAYKKFDKELADIKKNSSNKKLLEVTSSKDSNVISLLDDSDDDIVEVEYTPNDSDRGRRKFQLRNDFLDSIIIPEDKILKLKPSTTNTDTVNTNLASCSYKQFVKPSTPCTTQPIEAGVEMYGVLTPPMDQISDDHMRGPNTNYLYVPAASVDDYEEESETDLPNIDTEEYYREERDSPTPEDREEHTDPEDFPEKIPAVNDKVSNHSVADKTSCEETEEVQDSFNRSLQTRTDSSDDLSDKSSGSNDEIYVDKTATEFEKHSVTTNCGDNNRRNFDGFESSVHPDKNFTSISQESGEPVNIVPLCSYIENDHLPDEYPSDSSKSDEEIVENNEISDEIENFTAGTPDVESSTVMNCPENLFDHYSSVDDYHHIEEVNSVPSVEVETEIDLQSGDNLIVVSNVECSAEDLFAENNTEEDETSEIEQSNHILKHHDINRVTDEVERSVVNGNGNLHKSLAETMKHDHNRNKNQFPSKDLEWIEQQETRELPVALNGFRISEINQEVCNYKNHLLNENSEQTKQKDNDTHKSSVNRYNGISRFSKIKSRRASIMQRRKSIQQNFINDEDFVNPYTIRTNGQNTLSPEKIKTCHTNLETQNHDALLNPSETLAIADFPTKQNFNNFNGDAPFNRYITSDNVCFDEDHRGSGYNGVKNIDAKSFPSEEKNGFDLSRRSPTQEIEDYSDVQSIFSNNIEDVPNSDFSNDSFTDDLGPYNYSIDIEEHHLNVEPEETQLMRDLSEMNIAEQQKQQQQLTPKSLRVILKREELIPSPKKSCSKDFFRFEEEHWKGKTAYFDENSCSSDLSDISAPSYEGMEDFKDYIKQGEVRKSVLKSSTSEKKNGRCIAFSDNVLLHEIMFADDSRLETKTTKTVRIKDPSVPTRVKDPRTRTRHLYFDKEYLHVKISQASLKAYGVDLSGTKMCRFTVVVKNTSKAVIDKYLKLNEQVRKLEDRQRKSFSMYVLNFDKYKAASSCDSDSGEDSPLRDRGIPSRNLPYTEKKMGKRKRSLNEELSKDPHDSSYAMPKMKKGRGRPKKNI